MKVKLSDGRVFDAWQWNGTEFPPEEFEGLGFSEDQNGYDLYRVDDNFALELGRKRHYLKQDEWVLKSNKGAFALVSNKWFKENTTKV